MTGVIGTDRASWSITEVATRNGLSKAFVRLEIKRGRLRAKRIGGRVLIPVTAEENWLGNAPEVMDTGRPAQELHPEGH